MLWLFQIPMALSLTLTRCAITVFFMRTLFTHAFPWLRNIGSHHSNLMYHLKEPLVDSPSQRTAASSSPLGHA